MNFDNAKSVIFINLQSSTSQKTVYITYKIDAGSDVNVMLFKLFKSLFPNEH